MAEFERDELVRPDTVVTIAYRLYDAQGQLFEEVSSEEPLRYTHGYAQVLPALDEGLAGGRVGERRSLVVPPELGFGERDEQARLEIDRHDFPGGSTVQDGAEVVATAADGSDSVLRVIEVSDTAISVDLNHPLAGQTVRLDIEICAVRPATDEEIDAAQAEISERIAYESAIVYESDRGGGVSGPLVPLRTKPACSGEGETP